MVAKIERVLVDSGPLIALFDANDEQHEVCAAILKTLASPLWTIWPVITETMYFLSASLKAQELLLDRIEKGVVALLELGPADMPRLRELMKKYEDLPMDFADAALVRVAERENLVKIFTLDRRDFSLYRPSHTRHFRILP